MSEKMVRITIVNHLAQDIATTPDAIWRTILDEYVEALKFRDLGYEIVPLDDPAAVLGGYRMLYRENGAIVADTSCIFTERDEGAQRLSIFSDNRSAANKMVVYVTYRAVATNDGACYEIDCHSSLDIPLDETPGATAKSVAEMKIQFDDALGGYLARIKGKLEGTAAPAIK